MNHITYINNCVMKSGSPWSNFESEYKPILKISIMKKNLLLGFLILFLLSTTAFAALADPKKEADKPAFTNTRENKLSEEELSRMNRRAETDNISKTNLANKETNDSKNNLKSSNQDVVVVGHRHHGYYWGGGVLLLILIIILVV
jgi:hypothetical protein